MELKSRIAPTPSGYLHQGNAFNFLLTQHIVQQAGGSLRLRIDDLDALRVRPEYIADIFDTLNWLGITWDEGPRTAEEHRTRYSQQLRTDRYRQYLNALVSTGKVFACNCSRSDVAYHSPDGHYSGACIGKNIPLDTPDTALRVITPDPCIVTMHDRIKGDITTDLYRVMRHFIIRRRDGIPAYHLASLTDDVDFGINCIVRGEDLLHSTAAQLYLAGLMGATAFSDARFYHHPLIVDDNSRKLSKSSGSVSLKHQRLVKGAEERILGSASSWIASLLSLS